MRMRDSLERLLQGSIDYAGLFPPAKLGMAESILNYIRYINGDEAWVMNRFACPSSGLAELASGLRGHTLESPIPITVIGRVSSAAEWEAGLEADATAMNEFMSTCEDKAEIESYEAKIPDHAGVKKYANDMRNFDEIELFAELPWDGPMAESLAAIADCDWLGAKSRTGGDAKFSPADLAGFVHECLSLDVPFKLTAGLHEPFTHSPSAIGFLNVFGACAIAVAEDLPARQIEVALLDGKANNWRFGDESIQWGEFRAMMDDIDIARDLFLSFGSCSVDEPLRGLEKLGLVR